MRSDLVKDAQGQDWGRDSRKRDVHSEGAGAGDAGRRGVGITGLAPLGVGGGLSVPCVRSFPGYLPFHTRQVRRDGWSGASRVVRRHRASCSRPCPPTPTPRSLTRARSLSQKLGRAQQAAVCSACGAATVALRTADGGRARPAGAQSTSSRTSGRRVVAEDGGDLCLPL